MSIKDDVINFVNGDAAFARLFTGGIYKQKATITNFPYLEITDLGVTGRERVGGQIAGQPYLANVRFQLTAFAEGEPAANGIQSFLESRFNPAVIALSDGTQLNIFNELSVVTEDDRLSENQVPVHMVVLHYRLLVQKSLP